MPTISANDGAHIYYEEAGSGPALVMIPGWGCTHRFFSRNIEPLSATCRVVALDPRAHGDSEKVAHGHRIARYARDVKDLIEALGLEDVTLLGWSMGAAICWSYLELFGAEHVAAHVSVDQSPKQYYDEHWRFGQPGCYDAESLAVLTTRLDYDPGSVARDLVAGCFGRTLVPSPEEVETLAGEIDKCPPRVRAAIMADHTHLDWRDLLPRIGVPTLVCVGRQSRIFPWQGSAYVGEHVPGAETVFFEESGHMPFYEEPDKFNATVAAFVQRAPGRAAVR
ncbi:MAG: alpha/beta fold hydrolase [Candidatus Limnocylindrales bacterium]